MTDNKILTAGLLCACALIGVALLIIDSRAAPPDYVCEPGVDLGDCALSADPQRCARSPLLSWNHGELTPTHRTPADGYKVRLTIDGLPHTAETFDVGMPLRGADAEHALPLIRLASRYSGVWTNVEVWAYNGAGDSAPVARRVCWPTVWSWVPTTQFTCVKPNGKPCW